MPDLDKIQEYIHRNVNYATTPNQLEGLSQTAVTFFLNSGFRCNQSLYAPVVQVDDTFNFCLNKISPIQPTPISLKSQLFIATRKLIVILLMKADINYLPPEDLKNDNEIQNISRQQNSQLERAKELFITMVNEFEKPALVTTHYEGTWYYGVRKGFEALLSCLSIPFNAEHKFFNFRIIDDLTIEFAEEYVFQELKKYLVSNIEDGFFMSNTCLRDIFEKGIKHYRDYLIMKSSEYFATLDSLLESFHEPSTKKTSNQFSIEQSPHPTLNRIICKILQNKEISFQKKKSCINHKTLKEYRITAPPQKLNLEEIKKNAKNIIDRYLKKKFSLPSSNNSQTSEAAINLVSDPLIVTMQSFFSYTRPSEESKTKKLLPNYEFRAKNENCEDCTYRINLPEPLVSLIQKYLNYEKDYQNYICEFSNILPNIKRIPIIIENKIYDFDEYLGLCLQVSDYHTGTAVFKFVRPEERSKAIKPEEIELYDIFPLNSITI